jgi:hypothetical protein
MIPMSRSAACTSWRITSRNKTAKMLAADPTGWTAPSVPAIQAHRPIGL